MRRPCGDGAGSPSRCTQQESMVMRCVLCHIGTLRPIHLIIRLSYDGRTFPLDLPDGRICDHCDEEYMGVQGAAFLMTHRRLAPQARMSVTITRVEETS